MATARVKQPALRLPLTTPPKTKRKSHAASGAFYCAASLALIYCNKVVLTQHKFPSSTALAAAQFLFTCLSVGSLSFFNVVDIARPTIATVQNTLPLTVLYLSDVVLGLAATSALSLPMFTVLRRASIPMTMCLERIVGQAKPSLPVVMSVWGMMIGAGVAALDDLAFDARSYFVVLCNDMLTAARGVYVKSALSRKRMSKLSLLFYNASLAFVLVFPGLTVRGDLVACFNWITRATWIQRFTFVLSAGLGPVLQYAIFLCTQHNSALTTTVLGALKNILTAYIGMFVDYDYSLFNFLGITISCVSSFVYSVATFTGNQPPPPPAPVKDTAPQDDDLKQAFSLFGSLVQPPVPDTPIPR